MLKKDNISQDNPTLQNLYWPPVNYSMPSKHIKSYLTTDLALDELLENSQDFD